MMLGNRNFSWNKGLKYGYDTLLFDLLYAGSGYICMCLCMGEMSSALPFSGGIFGYVRAALGPFNGFLVASCEFVYCTTYIVVKTQNLMDVFGSEDSIDSNIYYALVVLIYGICLCLSLIGGKPVFILTSLIGFFTVSVLLIYFFGTLASVGTGDISYSRYGGSSQSLTWASVMAGRFYVGSQYSGIQYFPLLSQYLKDPRSQVPRMMIISCVIFILFSVFITLAAISQAPGAEALASADLPLKYGFARLFDVNIDVAKWIDIPCLFGVVFGFFYCSGKQLFAITQSGLLPSFLNATIPGVDTPYLCYTLAACVGAALNLYALSYPDHLVEIEAISVLATLYICILCLIAYMVFRRKFSSMTHAFVNPFGDGAAIYGIIYYLTSGIGLIFYSSIEPFYLVAFAIYLVVATIFFWAYLVKNQKFSEEEKKMMFKAYLINANLQAKQRNLHHHHHPSGHVKNNKVVPSSSHHPTQGKCCLSLLPSTCLRILMYPLGAVTVSDPSALEHALPV